jgi:hypothetical protein
VELERAVRPLLVVVLDEDSQHAPEVAAIDDQRPVETCGADGSDEPLGDGVACGARTGVFTTRMPPPNTSSKARCICCRDRGSQAHVLVRQHQAEVARPLGDPGARRVGRAASKPHAALACAMKNSTQ